MEKTVRSVQEMAEFAKEFVEGIETGGSASRLIALSGELGAGKTTFMKGVAKAFGITEEITSPTYVIMKSFQLKAFSFQLLIHIDAYRIEDSKELLDLKWKKMIADPKNIIFIEWPEKISDILPPETKTIYFKFVDETTREIHF